MIQPLFLLITCVFRVDRRRCLHYTENWSGGKLILSDIFLQAPSANTSIMAKNNILRIERKELQQSLK